jgi:hypothetical protein
VRLLASVVAIPILAILVVGLNVLLVVYTIDLILSGWILIVLFLFPILMTFIYWASVAAYAPLSLATSDDGSGRQRVVGLLLIPTGLILAFLLWQAQNWFIYGFLDSDPRLYNWIFERIGLEI